MFNDHEKFQWAVINDRDAEEKHIRQMVENFHKEGFRNCENETALHMAIDPKWLVNCNPVSSLDGMQIQDVPRLTLADEGILAASQGRLIVLSGNHRRLAQQRFIAELIGRRPRLEEWTKKNAKPEVLASFDAIVAKASLWGVGVWDVSKLYIWVATTHTNEYSCNR
jgi:hypothetical protein